MKKIIWYSFLSITLFLFSCKGLNCGCISLALYSDSPYDSPVWHPSGKYIGFNHTPVQSIYYDYHGKEECGCKPDIIVKFYNDSTGFWLINTDGSNMHRILPYRLNQPAWSPDGKWIAYSNKAQVWIMPFDGEKFDTTAVQIIPFNGNVYNPAWSPDGKKIAFQNNLINDSLKKGIWIYTLETKKSELAGLNGNYPTWTLISNSIAYLNNGDSIISYNTEAKTSNLVRNLKIQNVENKNLLYSFDGVTIGFISYNTITNDLQLYKINSDGTGLTKITTDACYQFSWSPNGKLVYVNYDYYNIDKTKSTLWVMDTDGSNKHSLTYNNAVIIKN